MDIEGYENRVTEKFSEACDSMDARYSIIHDETSKLETDIYEKLSRMKAEIEKLDEHIRNMKLLDMLGKAKSMTRPTDKSE